MTDRQAMTGDDALLAAAQKARALIAVGAQAAWGVGDLTVEVCPAGAQGRHDSRLRLFAEASGWLDAGESLKKLRELRRTCVLSSLAERSSRSQGWHCKHCCTPCEQRHSLRLNPRPRFRARARP